ncbi:MAG TPA: CotH kinase family protein [Kiritimatiellia bacterium]|nr:CotH kinase family protein [Kiritimatiellia bacterium]
MRIVACVCGITCLAAATPPVVISEFMAENNGFCYDGFGNASDWLELQNTTSRAINLAGWSLSDNAGTPAKWLLPAVTLPPWGTLQIWASNADQTDPAGELHTNFALSKNGEFLGLYDADRMPVHAYSPSFPPQVENIAYGLAVTLVDDTRRLVSNTSPVRAHCPADAALGTVWRGQAFDDADWLAGLLPAGYGTKNPSWVSQVNLSLLGIAQGRPGVYLRIPFELTDAAAVRSLALTLTYDDGAALYLNSGFAFAANTPSPETLTHASYSASILGDPATAAAVDLTSCTNLLTGGVNMLAVHLMNCNATSSDLFLKPSLDAVVRTLYATNEPSYLIQASPGVLNGDASILRLPQTVAYSHAAGITVTPFTLTLSGSAPGQTIRYTTNGAVPELGNSLLYSAPLPVSSSLHIRARVFDALGRSGNPTTAMYTFHASDSATLAFTSGLPILVLRENDPLRTGIPTVESSIYTACSAHLIEPVNSSAALTGPATLTRRAGIHVRGSSSAGFPKKPYALTFWGEDDDDQKVSITGFPDGSDFALIGCWNYDRTYLHDAFMFDLSRQLGRYAPRTRWVEVFLIGNETANLSAANYHGLYVLEERIRVGNERLPIDDIVTPGDTALPALSGSYLFKADRNDPDEFYWRTARNFPNSAGRYMVLDRPKLDEVQPAQSLYIIHAFNEFENTVYGADPMHPETGVGRCIDLLSWADFHIMKTYSMDVDIFTLSSYFHKDRGGKIMAGPVWDFDRSLGPYGYPESTYPNVKRWDAWTFASEPFTRNDFWGRLHAQPAFQRLYWDRWFALRRGTLSNTNLAATIGRLHAQLPEAAATRDYVKWGQWPTNDVFGRTHSGEIAWMTWFATNHATWIDQNFKQKCAVLRAPVLDPACRIQPAGEPLTVTLTAPEGDLVYYTLDGSDPVLWNNLPAPQARACRPGMSVQLTASAALFARATTRAHDTWSLAARAEYLLGGRRARPGDILISEIHYHPRVDAADPQSEWLDRGYEFVELVNVAGCDISLAGCRFPQGQPAHALILDGPILKPGEHAVLARHEEAFRHRYGSAVTPVACWTYGGLADSGETVALLDAQGRVLDKVAYGTRGEWPRSADGGGDSLNRADFKPFAPSRWQAGVPTPGRGGYSEWFGLRGLTSLDGDADGDGVPNLVEYYTGADPLDPADGGRSSMQGFAADGTGVSVSYYQAYDRPDAWASLKESADLLEWYDTDSRYLRCQDTGDGYLWTVEIPAEEQDAYPRRFFRLVVWPATASQSGGTLPSPLSATVQSGP